jgi:hypothetical protein
MSGGIHVYNETKEKWIEISSLLDTKYLVIVPPNLNPSSDDDVGAWKEDNIIVLPVPKPDDSE